MAKNLWKVLLPSEEFTHPGVITQMLARKKLALFIDFGGCLTDCDEFMA